LTFNIDDSILVVIQLKGGVMSGVSTIITDLSKLKITKVKSWVVYFEYDGFKFFIKAVEDKESDGFPSCERYCFNLYLRQDNKAILLNSKSALDIELDKLKSHVSQPNSHIDKRFFCDKVGLFVILMDK